ncbi:MAG TPA: BTAD domain-containing putative transcriptional regulator [Gemmatimonadaceae bacterium]|nr:BTAD domain-containing putative transcriptional regulator [Gemmatimonadaceae bacterium]
MTIPPRSLRLHTLGGLSIGDGNSPTHRSRRALALLSIAAVAGADGVERDRILALLWPESDTLRANNSFRQILFGIRRDLGAGEIIYEAGRFRLNPVLFEVDLWDFEYAVRIGDLERAAPLYTGPFLESFHIAGLDAFERWADGERVRLRHLALTSLQRLAERASAKGDHPSAVERWRAANAIDPLSARNALGLLRALVNAGDRTGALIAARNHAELLRAELDAEPDESVVRYTTALQHPNGAAPEVPHRRLLTSSSPTAQPALAEQNATEREAAPLSRWRAAIAGLAGRPAIVVAALAAVVIPAAARSWTRSTHYTANVVAVLPLRVYKSSDSSLAVEATSLVSTDLDGAGSLRVIAPSDGDVGAARRRAFDQGAGLYVLGDLASDSNSIRLSASLLDSRTGSTIGDRVVVEGAPDQLLRLVDDLAARLVAARYDRPIDHLLQSAALSTRSVVAMKAFLRGSAALRERRFAAAADAFRDATMADTTFAIAYYRLSVASRWCARTEVAERAIDLAVRYAGDLPDRDQRLISAYAAWNRGLSVAAEETYRSILVDYPDDAEAWREFGKELFGTDALRSRSVIQARNAFEHALALDPSDLESIVYLRRIALLDGRKNAADSLRARAARIIPDAAALDSFAIRAFALSGEGKRRS